MMKKERNTTESCVVHIRPPKTDVIVILSTIVTFTCILTAVHWEIMQNKLIFTIFICLVYMLIRAGRACQRVTVDPNKLRLHILGVIPVDVFWEDVSQIGVIHVYKGSAQRLLGEMFVIVLKPCKKYKEGFGEFRWWNIRPKWRHPFLVKNIYCDTDKYKGIIEECSREKISFEREYS